MQCLKSLRIARSSTNRIIRQLSTLALVAGAITAPGCADKSPTESQVSALSVRLSISNSPGDAVLLDTHNASLAVGYGTIIEAHIIDANGNPVPGARPAWSSTDAGIATVHVLPDSGFANDGARAAVAGRSSGAAMIVARYGDKADTAHFTIVANGTPSTPTPPNQPPYQRPVQFDVTARIGGVRIDRSSPSDTATRGVFTPVSGATVRFVQLPEIPGDTIASPAAPVTAPTVRATATTNADGFVTFHAMPTARYRLEVDTPASSIWASTTFGFPAPYTSGFLLDLQLPKK
jgi:hypothetical protein